MSPEAETRTNGALITVLSQTLKHVNVCWFALETMKHVFLSSSISTKFQSENWSTTQQNECLLIHFWWFYRLHGFWWCHPRNVYRFWTTRETINLPPCSLLSFPCHSISFLFVHHSWYMEIPPQKKRRWIFSGCALVKCLSLSKQIWKQAIKGDTNTSTHRPYRIWNQFNSLTPNSWTRTSEREEKQRLIKNSDK